MLRLFKKKTAPAPLGEGPEELAGLVGERAGNLFSAHGISCSEAVLVVLDRGFGGGLGVETALGLGCGFGGGIGGSGCLCGALSGAVMGLGLFLGAGRWEKHDKKEFRLLVAGLHDRFRTRSGSTCCRELIADFRGKRTERKHFCGDLTGWAAREVTLIILAQRPELLQPADRTYLAGRDSRLAAVAERLLSGAGSGARKNKD
ncbi:MAG: C_GCAxxG_C_C family protein [Desulfobulbaceae bacterium]|nr:C_GCAxxG_C_C family protein [Desulfobulbaceae bacterium]